MKSAPAKTEAVINVDPKRIRPFKDQPREYFDKEKLSTLAQSIKRRGQLQPGMVREITGDPKHDYELVDGQRRWTICVSLGLPFRCVVVETADVEDQYEISVAANFQRAGHTPLEEARAVERLITKGGRSQDYVAEIFGRSTGWVWQIRHLNNLVPEIQKLIDPAFTAQDDLMQLFVAVNLARLPKDQQLPMLEQIKGLNSSRAVDRIRKALTAAGVNVPKRPKLSQIDRQLRDSVGSTIQKTETLLERLTSEEVPGLVSRLKDKRQLFEVRGEISLAIDRLTELLIRLGGGRVPAAAPPATPHRPAERLTPAKPAPSKPKPGNDDDDDPPENDDFEQDPDAAYTGLDDPEDDDAEPATKAAPSSRASAPAGQYVWTKPWNCPKCGATKVRFRRLATADPKKDYWIHVGPGCLLKIAHYQIKEDRKYQGES